MFTLRKSYYHNRGRKKSHKPILLIPLFAVASLALFQLRAEGVLPIVTPDDARTHGLESLRTVVENEGVPLPNLVPYVKDMDAARRLGKALFFDMAVASDGVQACASCHFNAGADSRSKNQMSPGLLRVENNRQGDIVGLLNAVNVPEVTFHTRGPNSTLERADFPFVKDIGDGDNVIMLDGLVLPAAGNSNDVASSQGMLFTQFDGVGYAELEDLGTPLEDNIFEVNEVTTRRVEPRNTPSTINAIFNHSNFWDGRANFEFNAQNPFGDHDKLARVFKANKSKIRAVNLNMKKASLASQASGPPLSHFEMSFGNGSDNFRSFKDIGRKLLTRQPLANQTVHPEDSLLAIMRDESGLGLTGSYLDLIQQAFVDDFWDSNKFIVFENEDVSPGPGNMFGANSGNIKKLVNAPGPDAFSLSESNFSFFYGVSLMLYQATLVSDDTPFDNWMRGIANSGFGEQEIAGLNIFVGKGKCLECHAGPELTSASVRSIEGEGAIEAMVMGDQQPALYDNGFYNIAVTPTTEDLGRGAADPITAAPLSFARQFGMQATGLRLFDFGIQGDPIRLVVCDPNDPNTDLDPATCDAGILGVIEEPIGFFPVCRDLNADNVCSSADELLLPRVAADGAFKTPGLRNVAQTAPYFHNGGVASLLEVVQLYNRGGNFCKTNLRDFDPAINALGLTAQEELDLVAFMLALNDQRVLTRAAPFDGPAIQIPIGHPGDDNLVTDAGLGQAADDLFEIPAVGSAGGAPLTAFLGGIDHFSANAVAGGICSPIQAQ